MRYSSPTVPSNLLLFNGGLNSTGGPFSLSNHESSGLQNVDFDKFGSIVKRNGYTAANTSALSGNPRITCLHDYELANGNRFLVAVAGSKVYEWSSGSITGAPSDITGAITVTAGNLCSSATFRDTALFTNGVDVPFQWAGSGNCAAMTVPASLTTAKYIAIFQNYTLLANVNVSGTFSSRIYWSNINSISAWTASDFNDVSRDDGQAITGLKVLGDKLVIFKSRSIWIAEFTGNADAPFNFSPTNSAVGCVANFSVQEVNNGLVFLSWDGLYFFDGFNAYKISDRLNSTFQNDLNPGKFMNAVSTYQHSKNRYWLAITSSGGSTNDTIITWTRAETTVLTDAFSVYKGMAASSLAQVFSDGITESIYFGDYSGFVYKADTGTDDYPLNVQTAINGYYYTNWISFEDICDQKGILSVYIYYQTSNSTLNFTYSYDFNAVDQYLQPFSLSGGGGTWGSGLWGTMTWGGSGGLSKRRDLIGRGRVVRFGFKNATIGETFRVDGVGALPYLETNA